MVKKTEAVKPTIRISVMATTRDVKLYDFHFPANTRNHHLQTRIKHWRDRERVRKEYSKTYPPYVDYIEKLRMRATAMREAAG